MLTIANPLTQSASLSIAMTQSGESANALTTDKNASLLNRSSSSSGNGLKGEYFNGKNFDNLAMTRTDVVVDFGWGKAAPGAGIGRDNFSVRWTGQVLAEYSETYTFHTRADDGVRLWVDGKQLINDWQDHAVKESRGKIALEAGKKYDIKLEYYENGGRATSKLLWSSASQAKKLISQSNLFSGNSASDPITPPQPPTPPIAGKGNGLKGEYFKDRDWDNLVLTRTDATVNFNWGSTAPDAQVGADKFSVRWTGQVLAQHSETYTFYTNTDDGVRLWVNGQQLVNDWQDHSTAENQGKIFLEAGKKYDIKLEYYEHGGDATAQLLWSSNSQAKEIISQSQLFSGNSPSDPLTPPQPPTPPIADPITPPQPPAPPIVDPVPTPQNQKPSVLVPGSQSLTQGVNLPLTGVQISDPDARQNDVVAVTLVANAGTLNVSSAVTGGVDLANISNNGTASVVLIGTLLQINATLANPAGVIYQANSGFQGVDTVQITVNDNGNFGAGGALTDTQAIAVNVKALTNSQKYPNDRSPMGINLNGVTDYTTQWPFVDVFKVSRPWISQKAGYPWGQGPALKLTADGWVASLDPGQVAQTVIYDNGKHYPAGKYTLLYEGDGVLEFIHKNDAVIVNQQPGRWEVNITPQEAGIWLEISKTNPSDPIRNIRLIMPGFENTYKTQPFHPLFLERLAKFSTIRFMDWMNTNGSNQKEWSDRPTLNSANQNSVAVEYMVQLANKLHADPWFTMPHQATDDYVRKFAAYVKENLDPSLKVHIEYSNEVWNAGFEQSRYAKDKGVELGLDTRQNDLRAGERFYSQRSVEIFDIWQDVFGGTERIVEVLAGQAVNIAGAEEILKWKDAYKEADSYGIANYFNINTYEPFLDLTARENTDRLLAMTPDQVLGQMQNHIRTQMGYQAQDAALAKRYGLELVAYEGGQDLSAGRVPQEKEAQMLDLFRKVTYSPRMADIYKEYLDKWKAEGGGLFNQFVDVSQYSKYGFWGALEYQDQDPAASPKYSSLMKWIDDNQLANDR
jgi:hypothetical protein